MSQHLQRELDRLKSKILALSATVEDNVRKAVTATIEFDSELATIVIESDEAVDRSEVEVEEECLKLLALHQPVAGDLRLIVAVLKLNNDLERIGDLSVNIAERVGPLSAQTGTTTAPLDLERMSGNVRKMLSIALDALVNLDADAARLVCALDDEVDEQHRESYRSLEAAIQAAPHRVGFFIHLLSVSRYLERIADHATNIAEDVLYMIDGDIVRHNGPVIGPLDD